MNDITSHNDAELSDNFLNDEFLWDAIRGITTEEEAKALADEHFIYTTAQFDEFMDDFYDGVFSDG